MHIKELITPDRIACQLNIDNKTGVLKHLSQLLAGESATLNTQSIFEKMNERETLGSTGFGHGIAIPHCRLSESGICIIACITLKQGINYNALDNKPVDLIIAILSADNHPADHLSILAAVAQMLSDRQFCTRLRHAQTYQQLYELLIHWTPETSLA